MIRDKHKETRQEDVAAYRQFLNRNYISSDFATWFRHNSWQINFALPALNGAVDAEENREHANVVYKYTMGNQVYIGKTNNPVRRTFERTLFPQTDADEVINANVRANTYTYEEYKASGADFTLLNFIRQKALTGGDWNENSFNYTLPQLATALAVYRMNSKTIRANTISQAQVMNAMEFLLTYREAYRGYGTSTDDENITLLVRRWGQNRVSSIDDFDINNVKTRQQVEDYMKDQINKMLQGKTEKQENKISIWAENLFRIASVEDLQHLITTVVEAGVVDAATTRLNAKRKVDIVGADNILSAQESAKNLLLSAINIWARKSQEEWTNQTAYHKKIMSCLFQVRVLYGWMYLFEVAHSLEGFDRYWHHRLEDQQGAKPSTFYDEVAVKVQEDWIESAGDWSDVYRAIRATFTWDYPTFVNFYQYFVNTYRAFEQFFMNEHYNLSRYEGKFHAPTITTTGVE